MSKDILYPLRRLHGRLIDKRMERGEQAALLQGLRGRGVRIALVLGTPEHTNLGDSAIVLAQMAFLQKCGFPKENVKEISFSDYRKHHRAIVRRVSQYALITHLGGGNMGSQWKREEDFHQMIVKDFPKNPMAIFPQTVYYAPDAISQAEESKAVYNGHKRLTIVAREKQSSEIFHALYPKAEHLLTPDIVLSATMETFGAKPQTRNGVLLCMRSDEERAMTDDARCAVEKAVADCGEGFQYTDMYSVCSVNKENRRALVRQKMEELASAKLIITDRLHGMVFAAITGTPCVAFGNYNHKVSGTYKWISYLPYVRYAESIEQAEQWIPELLEMGGQTYDNAPLMPYFEELAQVVRKYANN